MRALLAQLRVELILTLRRGENLLITVVVPVVLLIFFGAVATTSPPDFLVPGLLALAVMSTSMVSLGIATAYERYYGVLKRLLGSPLPRTTLIAAKALSVLLIEIVQVAVLAVIARVMFGWAPTGSPVAWSVPGGIDQPPAERDASERLCRGDSQYASAVRRAERRSAMDRHQPARRRVVGHLRQRAHGGESVGRPIQPVESQRHDAPVPSVQFLRQRGIPHLE